MLKKNLGYRFAALDNDFYFYPHYVEGSFVSNSALSDLNFQIARYQEDGFNLAYSPSDLFSLFDAKNIDVEMHKEALRFIKNSRKHFWPLTNQVKLNTLSEEQLFLHVCSHILVHLSAPTGITLDPTYRRAIEKLPDSRLNCGPLGMGNSKLWHGIPDARINGISVEHWSDSVDEDITVDEDISDGDGGDTTIEGTIQEEEEYIDGGSTVIECKKKIMTKNLPQAIGTCVLSSFIEKNSHGTNMAPTILINSDKYQICLYDSEQDVLLISEPKSLSTKGTLSSHGILLLWLVINYK